MVLDMEVFARSECVDLCYRVAGLALAPEHERSTRLATMETMLVDACVDCCKPARAVVFHYDARNETLWPGEARGWEGGATLELSTRTGYGKQLLDDVLKADTAKRCPDVSTEKDPTVLALAFDKTVYPSYALLPIRTRELLIGVLVVESPRPRGVDIVAVTRLRVAASLYACAAILTPNHRRSLPLHAE